MTQKTIAERLSDKRALLAVAETKYSELLSTGGVYSWSTTDGELARSLHGATLEQMAKAIDRIKEEISDLERQLEEGSGRAFCAVTTAHWKL